MEGLIKMAIIPEALIMGNIYDPETDCHYILLKVKSEDWDRYKRAEEDENDKSI